MKDGLDSETDWVLDQKDCGMHWNEGWAGLWDKWDCWMDQRKQSYIGKVPPTTRRSSC